MSADSPRRSVHKGAQIVSPQPINDRSIIDSVAGIINDIVPQGYAVSPNSESKESISWARFEYADVNDPALYPDYNEGCSVPPLLLVLGYNIGVQVWLIAASGEAVEVLSWRQGVVRTLRILPSPKVDDKHVDSFEAKRPMVAICDSAGPGPQFCNVSFISLKTGEQVKSIKFKTPVCDILANRRSVVVTFVEKIAVFDARSLEDVLTVTTCYPSPGPNPNPVALGTRWLAYSEKKLLPSRRSSGGSEGEGVQSYTATVLYAAKSLGKGLRGLGETVASSLTGNSITPMIANNISSDAAQPGVVTLLDLQAAKEDKEQDDGGIETIVAHFTAHRDAIVAMTFDLTGALLMTADKRGHDFHVFKIQPHPGGPTLAAVHHLYVLHRGDTTAKVQDMTFSSDARWAAVSTVRGTTHVFPVAPYGGPIGVRTHSTPHVVNRLSRFHKSAGLTDDGTRSHSPVTHTELPLSVYPYSNPRLPPYPHPTILHPLAQIRQSSALSHVNSQFQSRPQQRQRLHSDDSGSLPLKICACFAPPRAWIYTQRDSTSKVTKRAIDSLFVMACHGNLIQYDLEPKPTAGVPKEKVCDDTMIELDVEAKGQWLLLRAPGSSEIAPPLPSSNPLLGISMAPSCALSMDTAEDRWLSQVEIVTHAGPHRRLWMGPQFVFKTYNAPSGVAVNLVEAEAVEVGVTSGSRPARSNPVNMPHAAAKPLVPVVIDGSGSSYEQSPRFMEAYDDPLDNESTCIGGGESQLREDLAEAMLETCSAPHRVPGRRVVVERAGQPVTKVVNPLGTVITVSADEEDVSSSQEFDVESGLEPPKSVCAEEGPASLSDFEPEGRSLPNLTEICAEMRSASEPAIDSVPDESIKDVKEWKTLCVEAARIRSKSGGINFDRIEAFRDVPTSLSLCAEAGEIPNSPMTRARESAWNRKSRRDVLLREKNVARAKYVVNYDEDSAVLMENRASERNNEPAVDEVVAVKKEDCEKSKERASPEESSQGGSSRTLESKTPRRIASGKEGMTKCVVTERKDGVEDRGRGTEAKKSAQSDDWKEDAKGRRKTQVLQAKETRGAREREVERRSKAENIRRETTIFVPVGREDVASKRRSDEARDTEGLDLTSEAVDKSEGAATPSKSSNNATKSFEEDREAEILTDDDEAARSVERDLEPMCKMTTTLGDYELNLPSLDPLAFGSDDFGSDYHIVEEGGCPGKDNLSSNHSDEDIEHIYSSEVGRRISEVGTSDGQRDDVSIDRLDETSSTPRRKSSKSTASDDDMEHIHSSELSEVLGRGSSAFSRRTSRCSDTDGRLSADDSFQRVRRISRSTVLSDDDVEYVLRADVLDNDSALAATALDVETAEKLECSSTMMSTAPRTSVKRSNDASTSDQALPTVKSRGTRKKENVVAADSVEVILANPLEKEERWSGGKATEKDAAEEFDKMVDSEVNLPRKAKGRGRTGLLSKGTAAISDSIEIIDIDAMQKAETAIASDFAYVPDCKILESRQEGSTTRSRRSRKGKKVVNVVADVSSEPVTLSSAKRKLLEMEVRPLQDTNELEAEVPKVPVNSWSSIVKRKNRALEPTCLEVVELSGDRKERATNEQHVRQGKASGSEGSEDVEASTQDHFRDRSEAEALEPATVASGMIRLDVESEEDLVVPETHVEEIGMTGLLRLPPPRRIRRARGNVEATFESNKTTDVDVDVESQVYGMLCSRGNLGTVESESKGDPVMSASSKEASPEPGPEKKSDTSSSDDSNANAIPMDTEEDNSAKETTEKIGGNGTLVAKKGRSKKKKRR